MMNTSSSADALLSQADSVFKSHDFNSALDEYKQVVKQARNEFNRSVEVEGLSQVARMYLTLGDKAEGRQWLEQAGERATDSDPMGWSRYLGVKGRFEWQDNNLQAARKTFDEMYNYCHANALYGRAVDAAHMIAIIAETPEEQIAWGQKGIEVAEASGGEAWLGPLWNNMAGTYWDIQQYDSALVCYKKAREYHWRFSGENAKLLADYHVGMTYRYLGQYDEARKWLRPVLAWAERLENHEVIGQACEDLGECDIAEGNIKEGVPLLQRARKEYQKAGYDKTRLEIWEYINKRLIELKQ